VLVEEALEERRGLGRGEELEQVDLGVENPPVLLARLAQLAAHPQDHLVPLQAVGAIEEPPCVYVETPGSHAEFEDGQGVLVPPEHDQHVGEAPQDRRGSGTRLAFGLGRELQGTVPVFAGQAQPRAEGEEPGRHGGLQAAPR
jgi:hypothetical protein